ncbi:hypothetical protein ACT6QH_01985 [Xanthobacter sp. TB0139]|uniref:hypothetical protein n=1 Tax=Xanthobacter sp. TB0139 TaxID=3459178 RepID=UPI00403A1C24
MAWVRFERDFEFDPPARGGRVTLRYRAGRSYNVPRACALRAKAAGAAVSISRPGTDEAGHD